MWHDRPVAFKVSCSPGLEILFVDIWHDSTDLGSASLKTSPYAGKHSHVEGNGEPVWRVTKIIDRLLKQYNTDFKEEDVFGRPDNRWSELQWNSELAQVAHTVTVRPPATVLIYMIPVY